LAVVYAVLVFAWFVLYRALGDRVWWLALINAFAPYLFAPLVVLVPVSLVCHPWAFRAGVALPALLFLVLYGPLYFPPWPVALAEYGSTLTVMTFNVYAYSEMSETVRIILEHGPPDVVALQELTPQLFRLMLQELGDQYPYHTIGPIRGYWGMAVFSRYPLSELWVTGSALPRWQIQAVEIVGENGPFTLYNVHPPSTHVPLYASTIAGIPRRVHVSFEYRRHYAEQLSQEIASRPGPVIVAGDLNSTDRSDVYAMLTDSLTDAHRAVGWGLGHTFPARWERYRGIPYPSKLARIDMILASDAFVPLRSYVGTSGGESDHLPVIAEFGWGRDRES
jgi:endonuclease/exonuclease/phosphatase (EEP) superfamily protein YafD